MAPQKIIIDTDPGVDDILALLLALSASKEELEVLLISLTFGNINIENCLRNTISMFHVLEQDRQWRLANKLPTGYRSLEKFKPIVAVGADRPLEEQIIHADYFHGLDGLGNVHTIAPQFTPTETWQHMFQSSPELQPDGPTPPNFIPTAVPAHKKILELLRSNKPDTITIIAVGPLTNLALAAEEDAVTFLRVKEVVIMGGTIELEGNVTPVAEFNHFACSWSAARIYALTSPNPSSTLPPSPSGTWKPYPATLPRRLNLTVFPLDVTCQHLLSAAEFETVTAPLAAAGSPLAIWTNVFVSATFQKMRDIYLASTVELAEGQKLHTNDLSMHDPLCVWYLLSLLKGESWTAIENRDIRIETTGQWTRGMCIVDRRGKRVEENLTEAVKLGDVGVWLHKGHGNRVRQVVKSPEGHNIEFAGEMLRRIFVVQWNSCYDVSKV